MDDFNYMWLDEYFDYDDEIYEEGVYEDREIQENQRLLMLEFNQRRGETPVIASNMICTPRGNKMS